ncbi:MAG: hypothetical protein AABX53_02530 [Nanoarchaeota archaeon]
MEYVKLTASEQAYSKKELLMSQMETLNIMKRYQKYKELRKQELALKSILKRKIGEVREELSVIDRSLPRMKEKTEDDNQITKVPVKKRHDLEFEIEEIKRKIERLQQD